MEVVVKVDGIKISGDLHQVADFLFLHEVEEWECENISYAADAANSLDDELNRFVRNFS